MYACMYACMYVGVYVGMYVGMYVRACTRVPVWAHPTQCTPCIYMIYTARSLKTTAAQRKTKTPNQERNEQAKQNELLSFETPKP